MSNARNLSKLAVDANGDVEISSLTTLQTGGIMLAVLDVDNVNIDNNTISTTNTNGNLVLSPNGTGEVSISKVGITGGSITGITDLAVADGGTGASSFTANNVLLGNGTSAFQTVAPGSSGNILTSNGTTWQSSAPAPGGVTSVSAGDGIAVSGTTAVTVSLDFYTGSTSTNTSYPIGSYIVAASRAGSSSFTAVANNATITLQNVSGNYFAKSGGTSCAGTWRSRGAISYEGCGYYGNLCQRTA